jgi:radical SAM superfamily enzyme YgiQ (UPF0313 family)
MSFNCSFCTIINVQGRKSRFRTADDVEQIIRSGYEQGMYNYFITDDDFARNRNWEAILDRIIQLRTTHRFKIHLTLQVDGRMLQDHTLWRRPFALDAEECLLDLKASIRKA